MHDEIGASLVERTIRELIVPFVMHDDVLETEREEKKSCVGIRPTWKRKTAFNIEERRMNWRKWNIYINFGNVRL